MGAQQVPVFIDEGYGQVPEPMDLETLLGRVDARRYGTAAAFLADARLIAAAAAQYWAGDAAAVREVGLAAGNP